MKNAFGSTILSLNEFKLIRSKIGKVVATSGGFDPIHPGHISNFIDSKKYADTLVVIVNGDEFLRHKKGRPFQDIKTRCLIVSGIKTVDYVVPFEIEDDSTVNKALEIIKPDYFTKGGDRIDEKTIPEWKICNKLGIKIITGVGDDKKWSSSWFLENWDNKKIKVVK